MNGAQPGGTPVAGEMDFDPIGRALVMTLLSPGAGDGPDQAVVRDAGHYFGQAIGLVIDLLVTSGVGPNQEGVLRAVLDLPVDNYPSLEELVSAAATVIALRVRDGTARFDEVPDSPEDPGWSEPGLDDTDRRLIKQAGIAPPTAGSAWTLANAIALLDACLTGNEAGYVDKWLKRAQWAAAFSGAGVVADLTPLVSVPSIEDGNQVHRVIQARFREQYGPIPGRPSEILIERRIYRPSGDITLAKAKFENSRYRRLWLALRSPRFTRGALRLDLADLTAMSLWEVKPIDALVEGVAQLFFYSTAYNCLARVQGVPERLVPSPVPLARPVILPVRLQPSGDGRQRFGMPFERKEIPGLVGYIVIVFPRPKDIATVAVLDTMRRLAKELRRLRGTQAPPTDIGVTVYAALVVIAAVLLVGAAAALGPAAIAAIGGAIIRSAAGPVAAGLAGSSIRDAFASEPSEQSAADNEAGTETPAEPMTLLTFAGPIVCEDPAQAVAVLQAVASMLFLGLGNGAPQSRP